MADQLPTVGLPSYPSPNAIRDAMLRTMQFGFERRGLPFDGLPGSDHYIRADAFAKRVSIAITNGKLGLLDVSPLTATGDALADLLRLFGVPERAASSAAGFVVIKSNALITIPAAFRGTGPTGFKYDTATISMSIPTGTPILVRAVATGLATNLAAGAKITWDSGAIGQLNNVAIVAIGGLDGGADEDNEETKRSRLINRIAFPAGGGNVNQIRTKAEDSTAAVGRAYAFAAVRGPGSYDVAVIGSSGDGILSSSTTSQVAASILASMPGHASLNVTSVADQFVDVVASLELPYPISAGGAGGGWKDSTPWPAEITKVTAYAAGIATVNSVAAPVAGNQIGVWDPTATNASGTTGKMREYTVLGIPAVGGVAGAWTFSVQGGFTTSPLNAYVSAGAANLTGYANTLADGIRGLGPGEKTASPDILPRGRRQPGIDVEDPNSLSSLLLGTITAAHMEVIDYQWDLRVLTGTVTTITSPDVPATTADPPNRLALKYMALIAK